MLDTRLNHPVALRRLGALLLEEGDYAAAIEPLNRLVWGAPDRDANAWRLLAEAHRGAGNLSRAQEALQAGLEAAVAADDTAERRLIEQALAAP